MEFHHRQEDTHMQPDPWREIHLHSYSNEVAIDHLHIPFRAGLTTTTKDENFQLREETHYCFEDTGVLR
jgi:hypothetical protein